MKHQEYDKMYKEYFDVQDTDEMDKIVAESIEEAQTKQTAEGNDPLTEEEKETCAKKAQFLQLTRSFWAPQQRAQYNATQEQAEADAKADEEAKQEVKQEEARVASQLSS